MNTPPQSIASILEDAAKRVEAASGPNFALEQEIGEPLGYSFPAPPFTASIDAAMQLIAEGWDHGCGNHDATGKAWAWVAEAEDARGDFWQTVQTRNAATPALALTAAALRARAALAREHGK